MKLIHALIVVALTVGAAALPQVDGAEPGNLPASVSPPIAICPVVATAGIGTEIGLLSSVNGPVRLSGFAAGGETGSADTEIGSSGASRFPAAELGVVGEVGVLAEFPTDDTTAAVLLNGQGVFASSVCAGVPSGETVLGAGSTADDATLKLLLLNPYAGEATVDITVTSENGIESAPEFTGVVIPALSARQLDMNEIVPERVSLSMVVQARTGSVLTYGIGGVGERRALWRGKTPEVDNWLMVPPGAAGRELFISSPSGSEIEYQVDLYGPEGLVVAFSEGSLAPRESRVVDLSEVSPDPIAVRVISTEPLTTAARVLTSEGFAVSEGVNAPANTWLLPAGGGPPGGSGMVLVANAGVDPVTIDARSISAQTLSRSFDLAPDALLSIPMAAADGYRIDATGPVIVFWSAGNGSDTSLSPGVGLVDG